MKATCILSVKDLRTLLKGVNVLVSEARLHFTDKGLLVKAVDPANVAMVIASVEPDVFEAYSITEHEVTIGVDLDRLNDISKSFDSKARADITVMDEKLSITSSCMTYTIAVIDPSAIRREPKTPQLDLIAEVVMDAKEFKKAISAVEKVDDEVVLEKTDVGFRIVGGGAVESIAYSVDNSELIDWNNGKARAKYSLDYVKEFCKIAGDSEKVRIRLDNDHPCWLTFEIKDGFEIEYILAPRIEAG